jgi:hypothetical protein
VKRRVGKERKDVDEIDAGDRKVRELTKSSLKPYL